MARGLHARRRDLTVAFTRDRGAATAADTASHTLASTASAGAHAHAAGADADHRPAAVGTDLPTRSVDPGRHERQAGCASSASRATPRRRGGASPRLPCFLLA